MARGQPDELQGSIRAVRRLRARVDAMLGEAEDPELAAAAALVEATVAMLSARAHRHTGDDSSRAACLERARLDCRFAGHIIDRSG